MPNDPSFLGTGWSFPPAFGPGGAEVATVADAQDIHQSLQILLATQPGERVMRESFGCDLNGFLFEEVNQGLTNSLRRMISDAILYHEPRIELEGVDISESDAEQGLLLVSLDYRIRTTNTRYNMVYPFYLQEATAPDP